ncbi:MAG: DinB family protein [Acidobacteriota bacterium]
MKKEQLLGQRQYFDMVHGVTLRAIGALGDEDLDFRPREGMRSLRELIAHVYGMEKSLAEGMRAGKLSQETEAPSIPETEAGKAVVSRIKTVADAQQYARECHKAASEALSVMTDEELSRQVEAPYGTFPAWQFFLFVYDEHWHHRGQIYTYIRLLGKEPPMLYSYDTE